MSMLSVGKIRILQLDERLYVPGLRKHVEWLHDAEPVALGHEELGIPCQRCRVAREIPERRNAGSRDRRQRDLVAPLARRIEKHHVGLAQHALQLALPDQLLDAPGFEDDARLQAVALGIGRRLSDGVRVLFDAKYFPTALREEERERTHAAVQVDDAAGAVHPRLE